MATGTLAQQAIIGTAGGTSRRAIQGGRCHPRRGPVRSELRARAIGEAQGAAGKLDHQYDHRQQPKTAVAAQAG